mgnify:CR=1 FL=1
MNDLANSPMTTTSPPKRIDFNTPELQRKRRIRALKDRFTRWYVLVGGLAVLAAITLIFFSLAYVVAPLFQGASLTAKDAITPAWMQDAGKPLMISLEEQNQVAMRLDQNGKVQFFDAKSMQALNAQQLRLRHTQVLAPDSGVISARTATVGAVVGAGTELFRMVRKGRLEWRAEVTSTELRRIAPGAKVSVTAASGATAEGTVRMIAPTVDPQTRNALVYVDLPLNTDFRAGMFARGEFALGASDALTVPQEALVVRDGFSYVFVVGAEQRVQMRKVQTGRRVADRVEVLSGLDANASVAVRGAGFLNDGDLVRVVSTPPASSTSQAPDFKQKMALALTNKAQAAIN